MVNNAGYWTVENGVVTEITIDILGTNGHRREYFIAPPPSPFVVNEVDYLASRICLDATVVEATYKTLEPSIIGALSEAKITLVGVISRWCGAKSERKNLPFAQFSGVAQN